MVLPAMKMKNSESEESRGVLLTRQVLLLETSPALIAVGQEALREPGAAVGAGFHRPSGGGRGELPRVLRRRLLRRRRRRLGLR